MPVLAYPAGYVAPTGPGAVTAPPVPPPVPSPWHRLVMTWTGWDGSTWVITDPDSGVFLTGAGVRGLAMPPVTRHTDTSPAVPGSRWRGKRIDERGVFWPIYVWSDDGSADWLGRDAAFWRTMHPDRPGLWTVHGPGGGYRSLLCRYAEDGDHAHERDPALHGWAAYGVTLVAEQPFWTGRPVVREWAVGTVRDAFTGPGVLNISPGHRTDNATIDNPGDEPAWLTWLVRGPSSSAVVGIDGADIEIPWTLGAGEHVVVNTAPDRLTAVDQDGVDRVDDLGVVEFAPVPDGGEVPLAVTLQGAGQGALVRASLFPPSYRAW